VWFTGGDERGPEQGGYMGYVQIARVDFVPGNDYVTVVTARGSAELRILNWHRRTLTYDDCWMEGELDGLTDDDPDIASSFLEEAQAWFAIAYPHPDAPGIHDEDDEYTIHAGETWVFVVRDEDDEYTIHRRAISVVRDGNGRYLLAEGPADGSVMPRAFGEAYTSFAAAATAAEQTAASWDEA